MLLTEPQSFSERRLKAVFAAEFVSPAAIARIESIVARDVESHDATFELGDTGIYQPSYRLANHHMRAGIVMSGIGAARLRNIADISKGRCAAVTHDSGKMDKGCLAYRLNRTLTPEEITAVGRHAELSAEYVLKQKERVRTEDHSFLDDVALIVRYHHSPWLIEGEVLRSIAFDLHLADIFVSLMEDRHRPGLSQFMAIERLEEIANLKLVTNSLFGKHTETVLSSLTVLKKLYGRPVL